MAGFECTYARVSEQKRLDLLSASKHDEYVRLDYEMIKAEGIRTVREGLAWSQIDRGNGNFNFSRFQPMMQAAHDQSIQQIWDLNHFDFPDYLDPFSDKFILAYAEYSKRAWQIIRKYQPGQLFINPMNEPSFFAWMCDQGLWAPYKKGWGTIFKKQLIRAAIASMDAIWQEDPAVLFMHTDPYMYRLPMHAKNNEAERKFCNHFNQQVRFHSWDMLSGKTDPELGGDPKYLNILGVNYYFYNQQLVGIDNAGQMKFRTLSMSHKKRLPLTRIINELSERYHAPIVIAETGSYRKRREPWWSYILQEVDLSLALHQPIYGVCSYPTLDIAKGAGFIIPESGLWDFDTTDKTYQRIPHSQALSVIKQYAQKWAE
jgi:beta-glucosidase/6-phospho-beta-glucosidase/beta-galactosidase